MAAMILNDRIGVLDAIRRDHGDVAEISIGPTRIVIVSDPDYAQTVLRDAAVFAEKGLGLDQATYFLGQGLLTASGPAWSESRIALGSLFHRDRVQTMLAAAQAALDVEIDALDACVDRGNRIDLQPLVTRVTFQTIASAMLRPDDADTDSVWADLQILSHWAERRLAMPFDKLTRLAWILAPGARDAYRRLSARIASGDSADGAIGRALAHHRLSSPQLLRDQTLTMLLAGHETTTAAILWTLDLLSRHPGIAEDIAKEARAAADLGQAFDSRLHPQATSAVKEAMRLFPPVWVLPRRAMHDATIGPYRILAGSQVLISVHGLHRHPARWRNPDSFDPARFIPTQADPPAYMPFGFGARRCLGLHLGLAETVMVVAGLMAGFRLSSLGGTPAANAGLTLYPRHGVTVRAEKRSC